MNKIISTIYNRRSVRSYDAKPISKKVINEIIKAGNAAPSGMNSQAWRFAVVENEKFRKQLQDLALPRYHKWLEKAPQHLKDMRNEIDSVVSDPVYYDAPLIIFVIGSGMTIDLDGPMVCQNMMLAARSLNIGSCWVYMGQFPIDDQEVRSTLELRPDEKVYGPILFGYPKNDFPDSPSKKEPEVKWL